MRRRDFLLGTAAVAGSAYAGWGRLGGEAKEGRDGAGDAAGKLDTGRHRFGVNYTPSRNWWFCWNDWDAGSIARDLDGIAGLGADHLRVLLIWPYFQPNPQWVSPLHLGRLNELLRLMGERKLDALITVFTGQLSGWHFLPPFNHAADGFFRDAGMWAAEELMMREVARVAAEHGNVIGFDLGNEINTCWSATTAVGDAWMTRMLALADEILPGHMHVNGVDHHPWFEEATFSPRGLTEKQRMPVMHCYPWWTGALKYGGAMDPPSVKLLAGMAALIRAYAGTQEKPVRAGEFNSCIEALTEKRQAERLEQAAGAAVEEGVSWFTYWDSHDVDRRFAFNSLECSLGLLTNDGRVKEQGRVFRQLAETNRGKAVRFPSGAAPAPPREATQEGTWR
jgi:hypothetical protein